MKSLKIVVLVSMIAVMVIATGCGPAPTPTPKPTVPPPTVLPTQPPTPVPTATPVPPTATPTPVPPQATAISNATLRQGPSANAAAVGKPMPKDTTAVVIGKSGDGKWLQLAYPDAEHPSWALASFFKITGALDWVAVIVPTATPTRAPGAASPTRAAAAATRTPTVAPIPPARGILAYVSYDAVNQTFNLNNFALSSSTGAPFKQLGSQPGDVTDHTNAAPFAWAPNGAKIAYVLGPLGATDFLKITDGSGAEMYSFGHASIFSPSFSPDSRSLVYVGVEANGAQNLCTIDFAGRRNCEFFRARENGGARESFRGAVWGKWIYFVSNFTGAFEIWRLNADGTGPMQLTQDKRENGSPAVSPDGSRIAYYSKQADGSYQIFIANADGSGARKLTASGNNFSPVFSQDGNWLAYYSSSFGDIYMIDKNGNNNQPLTKCPPEQRCQLPGAWR